MFRKIYYLAEPKAAALADRLDIRAACYRAREQEALASAESASLERVREQRRLSAAAWGQMAEVVEMLARRRCRPRPQLATPS